MANVAKNAILRAMIDGLLTDIMVKTTAANVFVDDTTTLAAKLATLAAQADLDALQKTVDALGALSGKDKVSIDDLESALAALINGKADASALTEEINRAKAAEEAAQAAAEAAQTAADAAQADVDALETRVGTVEGQVATLNGTGEGSVDKKITDAFNDFATKVTDDAVVNSYKELIDWAATHGSEAAEMAGTITALENILAGIGGENESATVVEYVTAAIDALKIGDYAKAADLTALAGRVSTLETTVAGLGDMATKDIVSESDLAAELKEKVNAAAEGNHSHANKTVLDGITADQLTGFGNKANIYFSASQPENLTANDLWVALV